MSSFLYPNPRVRKLYGQRGIASVRKSARYVKLREQVKSEQERLRTASKKTDAKPGFIDRIFNKIRTTFK